jgi:hypothetical protein
LPISIRDILLKSVTYLSLETCLEGPMPIYAANFIKINIGKKVRTNPDFRFLILARSNFLFLKSIFASVTAQKYSKDICLLAH